MVSHCGFSSFGFSYSYEVNHLILAIWLPSYEMPFHIFCSFSTRLLFSSYWFVGVMDSGYQSLFITCIANLLRWHFEQRPEGSGVSLRDSRMKVLQVEWRAITEIATWGWAENLRENWSKMKNNSWSVTSKNVDYKIHSLILLQICKNI